MRACGSSRRCRGLSALRLPAPPCAPAVRVATPNGRCPAWASLRMCFRQNDGNRPVPASNSWVHYEMIGRGRHSRQKNSCRHAVLSNRCVKVFLFPGTLFRRVGRENRRRSGQRACFRVSHNMRYGCRPMGASVESSRLPESQPYAAQRTLYHATGGRWRGACPLADAVAESPKLRR